MTTLLNNPRSFDLSEVALTFCDSQHGGDKRKTSQQCFLLRLCIQWESTVGWRLNLLVETCWIHVCWGLCVTSGSERVFARSKAFLGCIGEVQRSRVSELQNPDEERPLAPHWRAPCFKFHVCVCVCFICHCFLFPCLYPNLLHLPGAATWGGCYSWYSFQTLGGAVGRGLHTCPAGWLSPQQVPWSIYINLIASYHHLVPWTFMAISWVHRLHFSKHVPLPAPSQGLPSGRWPVQKCSCANCWKAIRAPRGTTWVCTWMMMLKWWTGISQTWLECSLPNGGINQLMQGPKGVHVLPLGNPCPHWICWQFRMEQPRFLE